MFTSRYRVLRGNDFLVSTFLPPIRAKMPPDWYVPKDRIGIGYTQSEMVIDYNRRYRGDGY